MENEASILFHVEENTGVGILTLNRPEKLNAFNRDMVQRWRGVLEQVAADINVRVLIVTGAGKGFCAGGDMDDLESFVAADALTRKNYLWEHVQQIPLLLERIDCPVIAAINGSARGAGLDMALMCDIRVMDAEARIAESYIAMGLIPGDGGAWFLPRLVGLSRALELLWTGDPVDAEMAFRIGMVNRVVPAGTALTAALELARRIARQPTHPVRMIKRLAYQGLGAGMTLRAHLDQASSHMAIVEDLPEFRERLRQFKERAR
jgi:enoyl-CoA hydratase/carnithine racemase